MRFYGIEETDEDENSLKVLQSFLERQCGIEPGIKFQHVHRIGKPHGDGSPRAIIAQSLRCGDRELIFSKAYQVQDLCQPAERNCLLKETTVKEAGQSKESW